MKKLLPLVFLAAPYLVGTGIAQADPAADKLFAQAKVLEDQASALRNADNTALMKIGDDELQADALDRDAALLNAQALHILKADAKRMEAARLRHEARLNWAAAHKHWGQARNADGSAAHHEHDAGEFTKAAALLKDQPAVATGLENQAKQQTEWAAKDKAEANKLKADAETEDQTAKADWDKAKIDDAEAAGKVAAPTTKPVLKPVPPPSPSKVHLK